MGGYYLPMIIFLIEATFAADHPNRVYIIRCHPGSTGKKALKRELKYEMKYEIILT